MTRPVDKQESFWNGRARRYDRNVMKHGASWQKTLERTRSLLTATDDVLELGCASGELSVALAPHVQRYNAIDLSAKMIELAKRKAAAEQVDNVRFDRMDASDPRLSERSVSAVIAFNVLHLVDDARDVLARIHEALQPGGLLISKTPCLAEWRWLFRSVVGLAMKVGLAPPIRSLKVAELESLVSASGFEIIQNEVWEPESSIQWIVARR